MKYMYLVLNMVYRKVYKNKYLVGNGFMCDGLYKLMLDLIYSQSLKTQHINYGMDWT